jgi:hypothetical protein
MDGSSGFDLDVGGISLPLAQLGNYSDTNAVDVLRSTRVFDGKPTGTAGSGATEGGSGATCRELGKARRTRGSALSL